MSRKSIIESKIITKKSGKGYKSVWIYVPSKMAKDSSFPFDDDDDVLIEIKDKTLLVRKKELIADIIDEFGLENATLPKLIELKAKENQNKKFIVFEKEIYSYEDAHLISNRIANTILEVSRNIKLEKNHIAVMLKNSPQFIFSWFGIIKAGCIFVPINYFLRGETLQYILNDSDSEILIIDYQFLSKLKKIINNLPKIKRIFVFNAPSSFEYNDSFENFETLYSSNIKSPNLNLKHTSKMELIYTEGTTGKPKGIIYRHQKILAGLIILAESKKYGKLERIYCPIPFFHYFAQLVVIMQAIFANSTISFPEEFHPESFWEDVINYDSTLIFYHGGIIPALINQIPSEKERQHKVKWAIGGETPRELWEIFENRFGITLLEGWASTEAIGFMINTLGTNGGKEGSIGIPLDGFKVKIVDSDGNEMSPGVDNIGEIATKSLLPLRLEYYKTTEVNSMILKDDGYFYTRDLGYRDKDGYIYYVGRKVDTIKNKDRLILSHVIEKVAKTHPLILDSAVVGVPKDNTDYEDIKICSVLKYNDAISHEEFYNYLSMNLGYYMVPRYIEFKDRLRTLTGRVKKYRIREDWNKTEVKKNTWDSTKKKIMFES